MVHAVTLRTGRNGAASYWSRWILTDAYAQQFGEEPVTGPQHGGHDVVASSLVTFGSSIFALGDRAVAYEITSDLATRGRVDLAGQGRGLHGHAVIDPFAGGLHLLASTPDGDQSYVTVSPGGLTRTSRFIEDAPSHLHDLRLTRHHVVLLADGFIGISDRAGANTRTSWTAIDVDARHLTAAHENESTVVVHTTGASLDRWTLHPGASTVDHQVLDATPQDLPSTNDRPLTTADRYVWTISDRGAHRHDLVTGVRQTHDFGSHRQPGELTFVTDPRRAGCDDGGWLVGFVHDTTRNGAELVVLDAHALNGPAVATVHIPRRIPNGAHGTWLPSNHRKDQR